MPPMTIDAGVMTLEEGGAGLNPRLRLGVTLGASIHGRRARLMHIVTAQAARGLGHRLGAMTRLLAFVASKASVRDRGGIAMGPMTGVAALVDMQ